MMRNRVVLPDPDGPSSATRLPAGTSTLTLSRATKEPNRLLTSLTTMLMTFLLSWRRSSGSAGRITLLTTALMVSCSLSLDFQPGQALALGSLQQGLEDQCHQGEQRQN